MSRSLPQRAFMVFGGLALAGTLTLVQAAPVSFQVPLTGAQQVPPVQTPGSGSADLTYDPSTRIVTWNVTFSGLSDHAIPGRRQDVRSRRHVHQRSHQEQSGRRDPRPGGAPEEQLTQPLKLHPEVRFAASSGIGCEQYRHGSADAEWRRRQRRWRLLRRIDGHGHQLLAWPVSIGRGRLCPFDAPSKAVTPDEFDRAAERGLPWRCVSFAISLPNFRAVACPISFSLSGSTSPA
jgi:CHRD domain